MRYLALDIGEKRVGVAVSDSSGRVASPVCVLPAVEVESNAVTWRRVLEDLEPDVLVAGLPLTMAGEPGPQAERVRAVAQNVASTCGVPLEFTDVEDLEPDVLVAGLPLTMAGEPGPQAERVRAVAQNVASTCGVPLEFTDERLSSAEAKRILRQEGLSEKKMRGKVDMVAASLFLQAFLDARAGTGPVPQAGE